MAPDQQAVSLNSFVPLGKMLIIASSSGATWDVVCSGLIRRGHKVDFTVSDVSVIQDLESYDLLILDLNVYDVEAVQQCARLRQVTLAPLLVLVPETARSQGIQALELGADTFMVSPFDKREIVARSEALVRRYRQLWFPVNPGQVQGQES
jgi:DNA-binding response OmpR family regulator